MPPSQARSRARVVFAGLALALAAVATLPGCIIVDTDRVVVSPDPAREQDIARLELGATTPEDARRMFGEPASRSLEGGEQSWRYKGRFTDRGETYARGVRLRFRDGVLTSIERE